MRDNELKHLITVAKKIVKTELKTLNKNNGNFTTLKKEKKIKEFKSPIDYLLNKNITKKLRETKIPILSEENKKSWNNIKSNKLLWILDPLDGTVNYSRQLGSCAISLALFNGLNPIFGVIGTFPDMNIYFGGRDFKSKCNNKFISVSKNIKKNQSILCTGFPARYEFNTNNSKKLLLDFKNYSKIRMLGSACISLLMVASGKADIYKENNIMLWDVAAGIAIIEGAGGKYNFSFVNSNVCINITAYNNFLKNI